MEIALNSLERLQDMYGIEYQDVYNAHHDFRGVGAPLGKEVLPNAVRCLRSMKEGFCRIIDTNLAKPYNFLFR